MPFCPFSFEHCFVWENKLVVGDKVRVRQERKNKMPARLSLKPYNIVEKNGNSVLVESEQDVHYKRNITTLRKNNERFTNVALVVNAFLIHDLWSAL